MQSVTELRLESSTIMNEQITNVIEKLISRNDALEPLLDWNELVENTAEIHCECQRRSSRGSIENQVSQVISKDVDRVNTNEVQEVNTIAVGSLSIYSISARIG